MDPSQTALYAEEVIRLADSASLAQPFSVCEPGFSLDDAYRVSREVLRRREASGWRRIGRKIGFTNRTIYEQYQVFAPIFGYMYRETVLFASGTERGYEATVSLQGLAQPLIEPEIFFALRSTPPRSDDPMALLSAIESYGHGFEIVQCHFPNWKFTAADTVADLGLHGRYLFGPRVRSSPQRSDLADRLAAFALPPGDARRSRRRELARQPSTPSPPGRSCSFRTPAVRRRADHHRTSRSPCPRHGAVNRLKA
jgi:2-oxo-3-hexenedioate decarboxylase